MNDTINSAFIYEGKAIIKFVKNNKVYKTIESHNNATPLFFKYILLSITGANVTKEMPQFLMLANTEGPVLSYRVPLSKYVDEQDSKSPVARFTGYVPYGAIKGTSDNGNKSISITELNIYNQASGNNDTTLLATVNLTSATNTTITLGTTIIVEWNVTIVDANKEESNEDSTQTNTNTVPNTISNRTLLKQIRG